MVGAVLAGLLGYAEDGNVIAVAGFSIACVVMTFSERWGIVPSSEDAGRPQTLMLDDRTQEEKEAPRKQRVNSPSVQHLFSNIKRFGNDSRPDLHAVLTIREHDQSSL